MGQSALTGPAMGRAIINKKETSGDTRAIVDFGEGKDEATELCVNRLLIV
jgi:hypothetical protein